MQKKRSLENLASNFRRPNKTNTEVLRQNHSISELVTCKDVEGREIVSEILSAFTADFPRETVYLWATYYPTFVGG